MTDDRAEKATRADRRRARRVAGEQAGTIARQLMTLNDADVEGLDLDEDLRFELEKARRISSMNARRREERRLAGVLRSYDLDEVAAALASHQQARQADGRLFKLAESWRDRLIADPAVLDAFLDEHPDLARESWQRWVDEARRQRDTGKPKGASKRLFRQVREVLS